MGNAAVTGVGGDAKIAGWGTIKLISKCNGQDFVLILEDVLHVPSTRNNLISLGQWDAAGGQYTGGGGVITLTTKDGKRIGHSKKISNHLYKMDMTICKATSKLPKDYAASPHAFISKQPALSWEMWHRRFGHIGYTGLQKLLDKKMVNGFTVDERMGKPNCEACTQAKQHVEPFPKASKHTRKPGELTHIDLWGKYAVQSINGKQYYLLFVDDVKQYMTVEFLKRKSDAAQEVINYLAHLITQGRTPKAIQIDGGGEFMNEKVETWCKAHEIEIHKTALYSPSQNGMAEQMLIELGCTMLIAGELPEFLWEYAMAHAAYLRNRSYMKHLPTSTPYQGWFDAKPNISHLREFGAPVWVLLQGEKGQWKMLPKLKRCAYIRHDDGMKAIKYYNVETHKVLTSRNFRHLNPTTDPIPPTPITIAPDAPYEGEMEDSMLGTTGSDRDPNLEPKKR
jgi:hypothetical protein